MHSAPLFTSLVIATVTALGHFTLSEPAVQPPVHPATPIVDMTQPPAGSCKTDHIGIR